MTQIANTILLIEKSHDCTFTPTVLLRPVYHGFKVVLCTNNYSYMYSVSSAFNVLNIAAVDCYEYRHIAYRFRSFRQLRMLGWGLPFWALLTRVRLPVTVTVQGETQEVFGAAHVGLSSDAARQFDQRTFAVS